jgi:Flp pilus assembly pilin Flp
LKEEEMVEMIQVKRLFNLLQREEGQGLVEYALLICLVALMVGVSLFYFGSYINAMFMHFVQVIAVWCGL